MLSNKLKLNDEKTEAMLVGSCQTINPTKTESIQIGGKKKFLNPHVKNLGVFLDNTLSIEQHICHLCRSAYLAKRQIASIRRYLTKKQNKKPPEKQKQTHKKNPKKQNKKHCPADLFICAVQVRLL